MTNLWWISCPAKGIAEKLRSDCRTAESISSRKAHPKQVLMVVEDYDVIGEG